MRKLLVPAVVLVVLGTSDAWAHRHKPDDPPRSLARYWNDKNVAGMVGLFEKDSDLSYPHASFVVGRERIAELLKAELLGEGRMSQSSLELEKDPIRIREFWKWAIVDYRAKLSGAKGLSDQILILSAIIVKTKEADKDEDDEWSFAALRIFPQSPAQSPDKR